MKNLRFFANLCPPSDGLSYMDSGVKSPGCGVRLAYCTKNVRATDFCVYVLRGYQAKPGGFLRTWSWDS